MREYGETIVERVDDFLHNLLRPRLEAAGELGIDIANAIHVSQIDVYVDTATYGQEQYPEPRNELDKIGLEATRFLRQILTREYGVPEAQANLAAVRQISLIFGVKHSPWCRLDKFSLSTGQYIGSCYRVCNSCV
jgi:hypothetical protein